MIGRWTWAVAFVFGCVAGDASALNYKVTRDADNRPILLAYDCGFLENDGDCPTPHESFRDGFDVGERNRLRAQWSRGPFAEVWLLSGGGVLVAGIEVANELRERSATVRVPNVARLAGAGLIAGFGINGRRLTVCVSSCTVAFMGGQFRFIDLEPNDEATYEVHAGSTVTWPAVTADLRDRLEAFDREPRTILTAWVNAIAQMNRDTARALFTVFQDTLWLVIKTRTSSDAERETRDRALGRLTAATWRQPYAYSSTRVERDLAIFALEGRAALQDILMRVERDSMRQAIDELQRILPALGRRADAALAMVAAMYDTSSILETNRIPKETLLKMGYLTEFISKP